MGGTVRLNNISFFGGKYGVGYLVDPASGICLSQGLSHASLSMSEIVQRNCEWLGKTAIVSSMVY